MSPHEIFSALLPMDTREAVKVIDLIVHDSSFTLNDFESFLINLNVSTMDTRRIHHDDVAQNMERLLLLMWEKRGETEPLSHAIIGVAHEGNNPTSSCLADYGRIISLIFKVEAPT